MILIFDFLFNLCEQFTLSITISVRLIELLVSTQKNSLHSLILSLSFLEFFDASWISIILSQFLELNCIFFCAQINSPSIPWLQYYEWSCNFIWKTIKSLVKIARIKLISMKFNIFLEFWFKILPNKAIWSCEKSWIKNLILIKYDSISFTFFDSMVRLNPCLNPFLTSLFGI